MFHLIFWFAQSIFFLLFKIMFFFLMFFLMSSIFYLLKLRKLPPLLNLFQPIIPFIFLFQPYLISGVLAFFLFIIIFTLDPTPFNQPKLKMWKLLVETLKIAISIRQSLHVTDPTYFLMRRLKFIFISFVLSLAIMMYCSSHQIFMIILTFICSLTAITMGMSFSFFSSLMSLPFSPQPPSSYSTPTNLNSPSLFASYLKELMNTHPLQAMIEESFYEDNLQMGDFFIAYPMFFKASLPPSITPSLDDEMLLLWHTIRWESAFSKQTGSAASRWVSLYGLNFSSMPSSAHSVHTPLIPVFNDEIFLAIQKADLPTFNPFTQPPEWSPYMIVTSFLGWTEEEKKEERLVEMEEDD